MVLASSAPAATPAGPTVRFTVFSSKPITDLSYVPAAGAAPRKLQFAPTARSPRYDYRGAMPLRFVDAGSGVVVAEATIPPGVRDALLLFSAIDAGAKGTGGFRYQVSVLDDGAVRHGAGGLAMINFSGLALTGTVNSEEVTLKTGLNPTLNVGRAAKVSLRTKFKERVFQAYAGTLQLARNERALLILLPPFNPGSLEVQARLLVDQPPGTTPTPAAKPAMPKR